MSGAIVASAGFLISSPVVLVVLIGCLSLLWLRSTVESARINISHRSKDLLYWSIPASVLLFLVLVLLRFKNLA